MFPTITYDELVKVYDELNEHLLPLISEENERRFRAIWRGFLYEHLWTEYMFETWHGYTVYRSVK